ncbi:hypothetical protein BH09ACT7_BH09ACT7_04900 [soil metagenome]
MDDVGHRLTATQQEAVCAFFDDITAVVERTTDDSYSGTSDSSRSGPTVSTPS